jgi:nucleotide-binding universal stress UspA family protein
MHTLITFDPATLEATNAATAAVDALAADIALAVEAYVLAAGLAAARAAARKANMPRLVAVILPGRTPARIAAAAREHHADLVAVAS